jgi:O-antigen/teichoic acid export membrane protein
MSLKKNILKNGLATGVQKLIKVLEQLVLVPFFIKAWGPAYYGEWLTLTIVPSIMVFSDLGFGNSAANKFLLQYVADEKQKAANTAKSGVFVISVVVVVGCLLSCLIIFLLNKFHVFEKSLIKSDDAMWSLLILMIARIINFYNQFYEAYFRAVRRASLSMNLQSIYSISIILLGGIVLYFKGGVIEYALANLIVSAIFNPLYNLKAISLLGLHHEYRGRVTFEEIKDIAKNGFGYLLSPIWQVIFFQGTTFVIRLTLGPTAVTLFNTLRTLTRSVNQIFNMITLSIFPELQFEIGTGNIENARKLFRFMFALVSIVTVISLFFLNFFGIWFYEIWTNKAINPPTNIWQIALIGIAFNAIWWISTIVFQAFNKPYFFTLPSVIVAILSVSATYFLSMQIGLLGAALGGVLMDIILAFYLFPKGCELLKQPILGLYQDAFSIIRTKFKNEN